MNLTRRGIAFAVGILLLGVLSQWLPDGWPVASAWRWLAVAWLLVLATEALIAQRRGLSAMAVPGPPLRLGRAGRLQLRLHNTAARAVEIQALWPLPPGTAGTAEARHCFVDAAAAIDFEAPLTPLRLGALSTESLLTRRRGRFGFAWWSQRLVVSGAQATVQPDLLGLPALQAGGTLGGEHAPQRRGAGMELLGLRDYQPGDPLRSVAWKSAAKGGPLRVREFAQEQHLDLLLVIDAGRAGAQQIGALTRLHHAVNIAARLAERATALGDRVGVLAYAGGRVAQTPLSGGLAGVRSIRRVLASLSTRSEESDPLAAATMVNRACRVRALVIWFTDFENAADSSLPQAMRRLLPKHLPLLAGLEDRALAVLAGQRPVEWQDPYRSLAAVHAIERAATARRRLARLGCEVVAAPPEKMDSALVARYLELRGRGRI
jgi:uncharacterized protein (DUF58 family)